MRSMNKAIQRYKDLEKNDKVFITYGDIEQLYHKFTDKAKNGDRLDLTKIITQSLEAGIGIGYRAGYKQGKKKA